MSTLQKILEALSADESLSVKGIVYPGDMADLIYSFHYTNNRPEVGSFGDGYILAYDAVGEDDQILFHNDIAKAVGYSGDFESFFASFNPATGRWEITPSTNKYWFVNTIKAICQATIPGEIEYFWR